jgi:hypothetical protein
MLPTPIDLGKYLQRRYQRLVEEHSGQAKPTAAGPRTLPAQTEAFAATQAAWRFWHNPRVTLPSLIQPLLAHANSAVTLVCQRYALVVHDWTHLNYIKHTGKKDRLQGDNAADAGYDVHVALAVSDSTGSPLAPVYQGLQAADGLHDTRHDTLQTPVSNLDGLLSVFDLVRDQQWERPAVHIIDREADSLRHLRAWDEAGHLFLVRADAHRLVLYQGEEVLLDTVVTQLHQQDAFGPRREVKYHGHPAYQRVAEATVVLHREAYQAITVDGEKKTQRVYGAPLTVRVVVSRVFDANGIMLAEWLLFTNVPADVFALEIALWYYWRWEIESYFKLLKSAGQELENWQQETAGAIARRMLIAAMACALVWQIARNPTPEGATLRRLLIRLSGRQMGHKVEFTEPALLAGLWVLLALRDALEEYSVADLQGLATLALGGDPAPSGTSPP